jgi:hypothetical protein
MLELLGLIVIILILISTVDIWIPLIYWLAKVALTAIIISAMGIFVLLAITAVGG